MHPRRSRLAFLTDRRLCGSLFMPEPIQSVLVTGASSGIGKAIVTRLLEQGLQVTGLSRRAPDL
ncbi:hypothetical protein ALO98_04987, partial [Pseudomonas syringae pv. tagetis]